MCMSIKRKLKKNKMNKGAEKNLSKLDSREQAKVMASAARRFARANGKRVTMTMFVIEDLQ